MIDEQADSESHSLNGLKELLEGVPTGVGHTHGLRGTLSVKVVITVGTRSTRSSTLPAGPHR